MPPAKKKSARRKKPDLKTAAEKLDRIERQLRRAAEQTEIRLNLRGVTHFLDDLQGLCAALGFSYKPGMRMRRRRRRNR
jgi:hypothetical protein